ncbi:MAG: glycosyltransferase [Armatimonadia bacterium]|nr:glycosyltransferase [Armatimonadia bacterium]
MSGIATLKPSQPARLLPRRPKPYRHEPPYHIILGSHGWYRGGVETIHVELARKLPRDQFKVSVLVAKGGEGPGLPEDVDMIVSPAMFEGKVRPTRQEEMRAGVAARRYLAELRPDVFVGALAHGAFIGASLVVPLVVEYWHGWCPQNALEHNSHAVVAVSQWSMEVCAQRRHSLPPPERRRVIYNGVDADRFRYSAVARHRLRAGLECDHLVGFVGRIAPEKNPVEWLHAFASIRRAMAPKRVVGVLLGGEYRADVAAETWGVAAELGLERGVDVLHWDVPLVEMPDHYSALDLCMHTANSEGFGMVLPEALLCRCPVIAYGVGGIPEVGRMAGDAMDVLPEADRQGLVDAAQTRLQSGRLSARMRDGLADVFSSARMVREFSEFMLELIDAHADEEAGS